MANTVKAAKHLTRFAAIFLSIMSVVTSQGPPEISEMTLKLSSTDEQLNHLRVHHDASTDIVEYIIVVEVNVSQLILVEQIKASLKSISFPLQLDNSTEIVGFSFTTVCTAAENVYHCMCEDQYVWPYDNCIYTDCNTNEGTCNCTFISNFSNDGQMCVPKSELQFFEFIIEIEINVTSTAMIGDVKDLLERFSFPISLDNTIEVTSVNITTVCSLNGSEYQCRCEDQYFWPCEKCTVYGSCDNVTNSWCGCINAFPNDGQFCQLINEPTDISACPSLTTNTYTPTLNITSPSTDTTSENMTVSTIVTITPATILDLESILSQTTITAILATTAIQSTTSTISATSNTDTKATTPTDTVTDVTNTAIQTYNKITSSILSPVFTQTAPSYTDKSDLTIYSAINDPLTTTAASPDTTNSLQTTLFATITAAGMATDITVDHIATTAITAPTTTDITRMTATTTDFTSSTMPSIPSTVITDAITDVIATAPQTTITATATTDSTQTITMPTIDSTTVTTAQSDRSPDATPKNTTIITYTSTDIIPTTAPNTTTTITTYSTTDVKNITITIPIANTTNTANIDSTLTTINGITAKTTDVTITDFQITTIGIPLTNITDTTMADTTSATDTAIIQSTNEMAAKTSKAPTITNNITPDATNTRSTIKDATTTDTTIITATSTDNISGDITITTGITTGNTTTIESTSRTIARTNKATTITTAEAADITETAFPTVSTITSVTSTDATTPAIRSIATPNTTPITTTTMTVHTSAANITTLTTTPLTAAIIISTTHTDTTKHTKTPFTDAITLTATTTDTIQTAAPTTADIIVGVTTTNTIDADQPSTEIATTASATTATTIMIPTTATTENTSKATGITTTTTTDATHTTFPTVSTIIAGTVTDPTTPAIGTTADHTTITTSATIEATASGSTIPDATTSNTLTTLLPTTATTTTLDTNTDATTTDTTIITATSTDNISGDTTITTGITTGITTTSLQPSAIAIQGTNTTDITQTIANTTTAITNNTTNASKIDATQTAFSPVSTAATNTNATITATSTETITTDKTADVTIPDFQITTITIPVTKTTDTTTAKTIPDISATTLETTFATTAETNKAFIITDTTRTAFPSPVPTDTTISIKNATTPAIRTTQVLTTTTITGTSTANTATFTAAPITDTTKTSPQTTVIATTDSETTDATASNTIPTATLTITSTTNTATNITTTGLQTTIIPIPVPNTTTTTIAATTIESTSGTITRTNKATTITTAAAANTTETAFPTVSTITSVTSTDATTLVIRSIATPNTTPITTTTMTVHTSAANITTLTTTPLTAAIIISTTPTDTTEHTKTHFMDAITLTAITTDTIQTAAPTTADLIVGVTATDQPSTEIATTASATTGTTATNTILTAAPNTTIGASPTNTSLQTTTIATTASTTADTTGTNSLQTGAPTTTTTITIDTNTEVITTAHGTTNNTILVTTTDPATTIMIPTTATTDNTSKATGTTTTTTTDATHTTFSTVSTITNATVTDPTTPATGTTADHTTTTTSATIEAIASGSTIPAATTSDTLTALVPTTATTTTLDTNTAFLSTKITSPATTTTTNTTETTTTTSTTTDATTATIVKTSNITTITTATNTATIHTAFLTTIPTVTDSTTPVIETTTIPVITTTTASTTTANPTTFITTPTAATTTKDTKSTSLRTTMIATTASATPNMTVAITANITTNRTFATIQHATTKGIKNTPAVTTATATQDTSVIGLSMKINREFDMALADKTSAAFKELKAKIEELIDLSYRSLPAYQAKSANVNYFRPGSLITDFSIKTTNSDLNLLSANQQLASNLRTQGFNISDDAFSHSVPDGLYTSKDQIYPGQNLILTCNTTANNTIKWTRNGIELKASDRFIIDQTVLTVKNVTPEDSGQYECSTTENSIPFVTWQRILIPEPNIQVSNDKFVKCENSTVVLQCCVYESYEVKWNVDQAACSQTSTVPPKGCIICGYKINTQDCRKNEKITVTCQLTKSDYNAQSVTINAVNEVFTCFDAVFGPGNVNDIHLGDCDGDMIGNQEAKCNSTGQWQIRATNCALRVIQNLKDRASVLMPIELPQFVANLSTVTETNALNITSSPSTILTIMAILKTVASISQTILVSEPIMTGFLKTLDVIGSAAARGTWADLNQNTTTSNASSEILQSIESIGRRLPNDIIEITTNSTHLKKTNNTFPFSEVFGINLTTQINIPMLSDRPFITVIVFSSLDNVLPNRTANKDSPANTINGDVAMIEPMSTIKNISLSFAIKNKTLGSPQCVFWNFDLVNGTGGWDSTGCQLKPENGMERFTCECNHTTSFSILMSPFTQDKELTIILDYITYIGVGISMGSLVLCLIVELIIWKSVTRNDTSHMRHVSIVNIALSLLIANICFIIGSAVITEGEKTPEGPCNTATFFMHFFYLALFFWMFVSALLLLYRTTMVFSRMSRGSMMAIAFTVGYGAPLIIAVVTVASTAGGHGYIQKDYNCWLNWNETKALLAFVIPALTIVAINLLVLVVVLCRMLRRRVHSSTHPDEKHPLMVIVRCVAILTPLFGLTWGFGIGTMVSPDHRIQIVFSFLNSLQGFFILLFGTLLDSKVQKALARRLSLRNVNSNQSRSTSTEPSFSSRFTFIPRFWRRDVYHVSEGGILPSSSSNSYRVI